jgi:peptidyl-tRNA hydrolase, PTH1 family
MKLFVGLGNPGAKYARHRHNVGYMVLDRSAERAGTAPWRRRFQGETAEASFGRDRVVLLKPTTYMNDSGQSVGEAMRFLKIADADVYVFHDEIDLAPGKLKVKAGGGNAGHNGLRSLSAHIGNDYNRVRIGVGHPGVKDAVAHYVLHDFAKAEHEWLEPMLDAIADAAGLLAKGDSARFLTNVARAVRAEESAEEEPERPRQKADAKPKAPPVTGERGAKRAGALAENLKKWLAGRTSKG